MVKKEIKKDKIPGTSLQGMDALSPGGDLQAYINSVHSIGVLTREEEKQLDEDLYYRNDFLREDQGERRHAAPSWRPECIAIISNAQPARIPPRPSSSTGCQKNSELVLIFVITRGLSRLKSFAKWQEDSSISIDPKMLSAKLMNL